MSDTNRSDDWRVLCELASKEMDPKKLLDLITRINQALEEFHHKSRSPLSPEAQFYSIAPMVSQPVQYTSNLPLSDAFVFFELCQNL